MGGLSWAPGGVGGAEGAGVRRRAGLCRSWYGLGDDLAIARNRYCGDLDTKVKEASAVRQAEPAPLRMLWQITRYWSPARRDSSAFTSLAGCWRKAATSWVWTASTDTTTPS